jgi:DNA (cytosine-5)-methyltransferase 1
VDPHTQRVLSLCTGYGGLELALRMAGVATRPVAYVEREAYPAANLAALMEQGLLPAAPVWDDVATFEGRSWRGLVEILTAGFPCQPFSTAGKHQHLEDERWLWPDIERILRDVEPRAVFLENVPGLTLRGLGPVLGTLSELGLDAEWAVIRASDPGVGAPHVRARVFILAAQPEYRHSALANAISERPQIDMRVREDAREERETPVGGGWPPLPEDYDAWRDWVDAGGPQPGVCRDSAGLANRVERCRMLGNGVVPQQAAYAFRLLWERLGQ